MKNEIITILKEIYKPKNIYYGNWNFNNEILNQISKKTKEKNKYNEFIERYYYIPLNAIFKDEELVRKFSFSILSDVVNNKRSLYFSKKTFLENFIGNVEDLLALKGEELYSTMKKEIRLKKDMYRDFLSCLENSKYYEMIKKEYIACELDISLEEFALICKKKYTKLLSGYNTAIHFFEKELDFSKFIDCFEIDKFYLYTIYMIIKENQKSLELYSKTEYTLKFIEEYEKTIKEIRKTEEFYNTCITLENNCVYTIDEALKEYQELLKNIKQ